jgi:hypothetical protein
MTQISKTEGIRELTNEEIGVVAGGNPVVHLSPGQKLEMQFLAGLTAVANQFPGSKFYYFVHHL